MAEGINLLVYSMSTNEPGIPYVALDLGVMADLGKLFLSANDMVSSGDTVAATPWRVTMYLDSYPTHRILRLSPRPTKVQIDYETVRDRYESVEDRVREFVRDNYLPGYENGLIIGGHGRAHQSRSAYTGAGILSDGSSDSLPLDRLVRQLEGITRDSSLSADSKPFSFVALDSCCLATLEILRILEPLTRYVVAFQDEAPWNGFVNSRLVQILTARNPLLVRLSQVLDVYTRDAQSQDKPSSMSLLSTKYSSLLSDILFHSGLPSSTRKRSRDVLLHARTHLTDRKVLRMVERLHSLTVLLHSIPPNIPSRRRGVRHGISFFI